MAACMRDWAPTSLWEEESPPSTESCMASWRERTAHRNSFASRRLSENRVASAPGPADHRRMVSAASARVPSTRDSEKERVRTGGEGDREERVDLEGKKRHPIPLRGIVFVSGFSVCIWFCVLDLGGRWLGGNETLDSCGRWGMRLFIEGGSAYKYHKLLGLELLMMRLWLGLLFYFLTLTKYNISGNNII